MQRVAAAGLSARRDLVRLAAVYAGSSGLFAGCVREQHALPAAAAVLRRPGSRSGCSLSGHRRYSSLPGPGDGPGRGVSVVGSPDPLTWMWCQLLAALVNFYFDLDINSAEFEAGVKQALVRVSGMMAEGRYHELKGMVSTEMQEYVEERCSSLSAAQRKQLAVCMEDIIFLLPEDISVVFDKHGRKFCYVVMRFWLLSSHDGPQDPEGTKIFRVDHGDQDDPRKKIATAVYEFHRELTTGASSDWTVTTVWHWLWNQGK